VKESKRESRENREREERRREGVFFCVLQPTYCHCFPKLATLQVKQSSETCTVVS
jgi:hypothetical protein